jgi:magnesium chelatase subunit D
MSGPGLQLADCADATLAAALFAIDPEGLGGIAVRSSPTLERDQWLGEIRALLEPATPWRKVPVSVSCERLLGGLDVGATLAHGRPVVTRGVLASADGGVVILPMAERIAMDKAAMITAVMDRRAVRVERDGIAERHAANIGVLALDEGLEDDERLVPGMLERLAFHLTLDDYREGELGTFEATDISRARARLKSVTVPAELVQMLAETAVALGVPSVRGELFALHATRAAAAAAGCSEAREEHAAIAGRLVLAPRARQLPAAAEEPEAPPPEPPPGEQDSESQSREDGSLPDDIVLAATLAALPRGLLEQLQKGMRANSKTAGRSGKLTSGGRKGRRVGTRRVESLYGARLDLLATLKTAAPWQRLRGIEPGSGELRIMKDDLRASRFENRAGTTTIFVVDASGSQAAQRLGEVKAAIELLLSECYVRRDQVALIAFRGEQADVVLPPTRALARARRLLAALPAGGPTPLAAGIDAAREMARQVRAQGRVPAVVLMTDGRSNVARSGAQGRAAAAADAELAAREFRLDLPDTLFVDTARRQRRETRELAALMGARYEPLPYPEAGAIRDMVQGGIAA